MYHCSWLGGGSASVLPLIFDLWPSSYLLLYHAPVSQCGWYRITIKYKARGRARACQRQPLEVSHGVVNGATWPDWDM